MISLPNQTVRTLVSASNPAYANADKTAITLNVVFKELLALGVIPFAATVDDPEDYGRDIFVRAKAGEFGSVAKYVAPAK